MMNTEIRLISPAAKVTKKTDDTGLKLKLFHYCEQVKNGLVGEPIKKPSC
jgi:hypothetical protein